MGFIDLVNIFLFLITILLLLLMYLHYRKGKNMHNPSKDDLSTLFSSILDITQISEESSDTFNSFLSHFRKLLNAELCTIGTVSKEFAHDIAYSSKNLLNEEQIFTLNSVKSSFLDNKTIVGNLFEKKENFSFLKHKKQISQSKFYEDHINSILESKKIDNVATWTLFCNNTPSAYIQAINVNSKILELNLVEINKAILHIEFIICKQKSLDYTNKLQNDERLILNRFSSNDSLEICLKGIMNHFIDEYSLFCISFRTPRYSNINKAGKGAFENILFPLRISAISNNLPAHQIENLSKYYSEHKTISIFETSYIDDLHKKGKLEVKYDIFQKSLSFQRFTGIRVENLKNVIFPIYKPWNDNNSEVHENLYGIFYLRGYDKEKYGDEIIDRLKNIAFHISQLITKFNNKIVSDKISNFTKEIEFLDFKDYSNFSTKLCFLIKNVVETENVSIFMHNKEKEALELESTTAEVVYSHGKLVAINDVSENNKTFYFEEDKNSLIVKSFLSEEIRTINCISNCSKDEYITKFIESNNPFFHSILLIPIYDIANKAIGIIKCVGKVSSQNNLYNSFWEHDISILELISIIITRFRENILINKEKATFIESFCHEIISPLNCVVHDIEYLQTIIEHIDLKGSRLFTKKNRDKTIQLLETNIDMFSFLIDNLYFVKKEDADENKYHLIFTNTQEIISDLRKTLSNYAEKLRGVKIVANISNMPYLMVDVGKFKQVVHNILKNAIHYSSPNSVIRIYYNVAEIKYLKFERWHEISFSNYGDGILEEEKKSIFKLYKRGKNAQLKRPDGSGIGLFIVDKIMRKHGGFCEVSRLNNPTIFSIYFPINE